MDPTSIRNLANVRSHREDICNALGVPYSDDMVSEDFFLGRFLGAQRDHLDKLGLVNRGFCPLCGAEPIGPEYPRGMAYTNAVEYLCCDCWTRTNPHLRIPGYTRRYYTGKLVLWGVIAIFIIGLVTLGRACVAVVF